MTAKHTYLLILSMLCSVYGFGQQLTASAPKQVKVGQRFQVIWQLNASGSDFIAPEITDFQVLSGPNQSTSVEIVNGNMSRKISYTYVVRAAEEGTFRIKPAKIKVDGNWVLSNELSINVAKNLKAEDGGNDLFLKIDVSKRSPHIGEKVIADLKIYSRVNIVNFDGATMPSFEGFWTKDVDPNNQIQWQSEVYDGVAYQTGLIRRVILYPQKSGEIVIDPMELNVIVREREAGRSRSVFDQMFGGYQDYRRPIKSNSVKLKVKPLPSGKPADFSGLAGKFKLKATIDKEVAKANEAVTLKVTISGDGNLYQLQAPELGFPPDIEVYDPKTADNIKVGSGGVSGSRSFEYVLIPRYAGEFKIGPFSFSYFDTGSDSYKTIKQEAFTLTVEKGEGEEYTSPTINIANKEDIRMIGSDIRYIKHGQYPILGGTTFFYRSIGFYISIATPILLFILLISYSAYLKNQGKNLVALKSKRATGLAKKRLKGAKKLWDENKTTEFYEAVFKAMTDYTADKFAIPVAELNKDRVRQTLALKEVPEDITDNFVTVLDKTEFARFAPGADKQMSSIYDEALQAIVNVENHA